MLDLSVEFLEHMRQLLGEEYELFREAMQLPPAAALHINKRKLMTKETGALPFVRESVPWASGGFYCDAEVRPALHPYYAAGAYYLQEASAMLPAELLGAEPGDRVLDLCAAPGGKSTQIADALGDSGVLYANDISSSRAQALLKNLELAGAGRIFVTAETPQRLAAAYPSYFDKILADVPCSGEGMLRRMPQMLKDWTEKGPAYYAPIQRRILEEAWRMLRPGGFLVYSTCTFSREENEDQIEAFCRVHADARPCQLSPSNGVSAGFSDGCLRIFPHHTRGEGHFAAKLQKLPEVRQDSIACTASHTGKKAKDRGRSHGTREKKLPQAAQDYLAQLPKRLSGEPYLQNDRLYLLPEGDQPAKSLRYLRTGLWLGTIKNDRFLPSQALAMCLKPDDAVSISFGRDDTAVMRYLKGETLSLPDDFMHIPDGDVLICVDRLPLGWAKKQGALLKNKYYAGWRLQ